MSGPNNPEDEDIETVADEDIEEVEEVLDERRAGADQRGDEDE